MNALKEWLSGVAPASAENTPEEIEMRKWSRRGTAMIGTCVMVLGSWSLLAPLDSAVVGRGVLKVENSRQVVQHQEGGIVKAILVKNGDEVKQGQPLLLLEDLRVTSSLDALEQQYYSELAKSIRLHSEREFAEKITWPPALATRTSISSISEILAKEQNIFRQRRQTLSTQIDILNHQIREAGDEVSATERQVSADIAGSRSARDESAANRTLLDKGFISSTRMLALSRSEADYASRQAEHEADLARAKQKQSDLRFRIENLRNGYRDTAAAELKESTDRLNDMQQRVKPIMDARDRQQVTAPCDGVVVDMKAHTIGATIGPREIVMEIVPKGQKLVAELKLPLDAISDITVGMKASVRVLAFQQRTTPLLEGSLTYVSADALTEQQAPQHSYYLAEVTLHEDTNAVKSTGKLKAGMPIEAYLTTKTRNAFSYVFDPITQSLDRAFKER